MKYYVDGTRNTENIIEVVYTNINNVEEGLAFHSGSNTIYITERGVEKFTVAVTDFNKFVKAALKMQHVLEAINEEK